MTHRKSDLFLFLFNLADYNKFRGQDARVLIFVVLFTFGRSFAVCEGVVVRYLPASLSIKNIDK